MHRALLAGMAAIATLGCSEPSPEGSVGDGGPASGGAAGSANQPPVIQSVLVKGKLDADLASAELIVDVTDPDGFDDIAGGKLYSQDKSKFLDAFTHLSAGTFTVDVSWQTLNELEGIVLGPGASTTRPVSIEFTDSASNSATVEHPIEVSCKACGAACKACGKCTTGACTMCEPALTWATCQLFCQSYGLACTCAYQQCGDSACAANGCADPCGPTGCACECY